LSPPLSQLPTADTDKHKAMYCKGTHAYLSKGEVVHVELGVAEFRLFLVPACSFGTTGPVGLKCSPGKGAAGG